MNDDAFIFTLGTARPDRDEGEVGYRQNLWMEKMLGKYPETKPKIVAMHHHLIGIPDTVRTRSSFLTLVTRLSMPTIGS